MKILNKALAISFLFITQVGHTSTPYEIECEDQNIAPPLKRGMGEVYFSGNYPGIQRDVQKALSCFEHAAQAGDDAAYLWLGKIYLGVPGIIETDLQKAEQYLLESVKRENEEATILLNTLKFGPAQRK